jgi:hypothetical protein
MIKRIRFAVALPDAREAAYAGAPREVLPRRVAVCTTLAELTPEPKHGAVVLEWFTDADHLTRNESWEATQGELADMAAAGPVMIADECVLRGEEWLEERWRLGGPRFKHMAIALRSEHLGAAEFSERWRNHAGRLGRSGAPVLTIPAEARGLAYVQNHPRQWPTHEWVYDALNEVWFDDLDGLQTRIDWFRDNLGDRPDDGLVRRSWFLAAREDVLHP